MIDKLEGTLVRKSGTALYVAAGPMTLEVLVPLTTSQQLTGEGQKVELWTHLQWKDDGPSLFGFGSVQERMLFRMLIQVQGVGPKIALSMLAHLPPRELLSELCARSEDALIRVPGVGKKTAGRILVELGPRADKLSLEGEGFAPSSVGLAETAISEEAQRALTALGYPARDARRVLEKVAKESPGLPLEDQILLALRGLSRR